MINKTFLILLIAVFLGACTTTGGSDEAPASVEERNTGTSGAIDETGSGATSYGTGEDSTYGMSSLDDPQSPLSNRTIYFDYDSSDIQEQYRSVIEAHALFLASKPNVTMSLEGHADERGSREYNLALGERRALTVKRQMTVLGAAPSQIRTISYGEERPVEEGHNDYAWSQNRRVELIY